MRRYWYGAGGGDVAERTIRIRVEGWATFRGWVQTLYDAEKNGEAVPDIQDVDAVVEWLDDHYEIKPPVDTRQARVLIEACLKGGTMQVDTT